MICAKFTHFLSSFRTCSVDESELLRQVGESNDLLRLSLSASGNLKLTLETASGASTKEIVASEGGLNDGEWHTILVTVKPSANTVTLSLSPDGTKVCVICQKTQKNIYFEV